MITRKEEIQTRIEEIINLMRVFLMTSLMGIGL